MNTATHLPIPQIHRQICRGFSLIVRALAWPGLFLITAQWCRAQSIGGNSPGVTAETFFILVVALVVALIPTSLTLFHVMSRLDRSETRWHSLVQLSLERLASLSPASASAVPTRSPSPYPAPVPRETEVPGNRGLSATIALQRADLREANRVPKAPIPSRPPGNNGSGEGKPAPVYCIKASREALGQFQKYADAYLAQHGQDLETGGVLVGKLESNAQGGMFTVTGFIEAGPRSRSTTVSIDFDNEFINGQLEALRCEHPTTAHIGCIHRHPGNFDGCSSTDEITDQKAVKHAPQQCLVFGIVTLGNPRPNSMAITLGNHTFNFYVMSAATSYRYVPVKPEVVDLPPIQISPAISFFAAQRQNSSPFDFAILRCVDEVKATEISLVETREGGQAALVTVNLKHDLGKVEVLCRRDGSLHARLEVPGGEKFPLRGVWTSPSDGRNVWLSEVVLQAIARARQTDKPINYMTHGAWYDQDAAGKMRLTKEREVMVEKYGRRATLHVDGANLFWQITIHQGDRAFPIQIHYPSSYPHTPPEIASVLPLPSCPHRLSNHRMCWIDPARIKIDWVPGRDTAAVCVPVAHRWYACLLIYLKNGKWPEAADHA